MLQFFTAGIFAGGVQSIAVTITIFFFLQSGLLDLRSFGVGSETAAPLTKATALLTGVYLLTALGLALSRNRFVAATALRLRQASRRLYSVNPDYARMALLAQLTIAAVGSGLLALRPPPLPLIEFADANGCAAIIPLIWPAVMSVAAATFGANAHAAAESL
jgi:preprotein translocase subunit SecG